MVENVNMTFVFHSSSQEVCSKAKTDANWLT